MNKLLVLLSIILFSCEVGFIENEENILIIKTKRKASLSDVKYYYQVSIENDFDIISFYSDREFDVGDTLQLCKYVNNKK